MGKRAQVTEAPQTKAARSVKEILEDRKALDAELDAARKNERRATITNIVGLMVEAGLTIEQVKEAYDNRNTKTVKPAKYQDPDNAANTWTGNGRNPKWLVGNKDDFLISKLAG